MAFGDRVFGNYLDLDEVIKVGGTQWGLILHMRSHQRACSLSPPSYEDTERRWPSTGEEEIFHQKSTIQDCDLVYLGSRNGTTETSGFAKATHCGILQ